MKGLQDHEIDMAKVPVTSGWHPELDKSPELSSALHTLFMQLIGIGLWTSVIGRVDIYFAISSLSRYSLDPRDNHLIELKKVFGYLKCKPDQRILIDSSDPGDQGDFFTEYADMVKFYPDAREDIGEHPKPQKKCSSLL